MCLIFGLYALLCALICKKAANKNQWVNAKKPRDHRDHCISSISHRCGLKQHSCKHHPLSPAWIWLTLPSLHNPGDSHWHYQVCAHQWSVSHVSNWLGQIRKKFFPRVCCKHNNVISLSYEMSYSVWCAHCGKSTHHQLSLATFSILILCWAVQHSKPLIEAV